MTQARSTLKKRETAMDCFLCERIACGGALHTRAGLMMKWCMSPRIAAGVLIISHSPTLYELSQMRI